MATSDSSTGPTRLEVCQELAAELQLHRSGVHGDKMAKNLLRFEEGRDLIGVGPDANRAIYYELASRSIVAVQFDKHGVYRGQQELLQRELDDPGAWVEAYGNGLVWVHPRLSPDTS